jgi:hypothetical protein
LFYVVESSLVRFLGYDLELKVESILAGDQGPTLFTARDDEGGAWLVAQVAFGPSSLVWLCAPVSDCAALAVVDHRADPRDAIRHSLTGTVEIVTIRDGRSAPDRCLLCAAVPHDALAAVTLPEPVPLAG